jgi:3-hydroxyacyl-CoA dehydrogenase
MKQIAVVGGGLIGMSWASLFLARGMEVVVVEPRSEAQAELQRFVEDAWPQLQALGLTVSDPVCQATFCTDMQSLANVDYVQENGPDRLEVKRQLVRQLEDVIAPDVVIASSTSSLLASDIQNAARHPQRILVAHPMNPPHLVPMVELVAGRQTSDASMQIAEDFYRQMQRVTIRLQKEVVGHLANRLTSALYREAVHIAAQGIASVKDIDQAITYGPGMRWALLGPHLTYHLGGGAGGYRHYLDHLGPTQEARWQELGEPELTEALIDVLVAGVEEELAGQDRDSLVQRRDQALVELFKLKKKYGF